jgi:nucleoside-diphosphate-sugar epimerase
MKILVAGAGGFIGGHLVEFLKDKGYWVRGVDIKHHEHREKQGCDEFELADLTHYGAAVNACRGIDWVFQLAADMGGMGYLAEHDADMMRINTRINLNMLEAARQSGVERYFFSSSACVYPNRDAEHADLAENDAYPANPHNEYGWEKLYTERLCAVYARDYGLDTRAARFHNCYGEYGTWRGGREKAPAALCRKVAASKLARNDGTAEIDVWGDGAALRSYIHVDDLINGIWRLMEMNERDVYQAAARLSVHITGISIESRAKLYQVMLSQPLNLGDTHMVTVDELAYAVARAAGVELSINHVDGPVGVQARNADIGYAKELLNWEPQIQLKDGIARLYQWVEGEVKNAEE